MAVYKKDSLIKAIEAIVRYAHEQKAIQRPFTVDELFAKELTGV